MLPEFLTYLEAERRYSPLTIRNYRRDIERFLAWLGVDEASFDPSQLRTEDIREWILYRTKNRTSAGVDEPRGVVASGIVALPAPAGNRHAGYLPERPVRCVRRAVCPSSSPKAAWPT